MENSKTPIFIEKAKMVHGDKYDYSLVDYVNNKDKVKIICPEHGEFEQTPNTHLLGSGCPECGRIIKSNKRKLDINNFIKKAKEVHGDKYDYSLVNYIDTKTKVKILCLNHGIFEQTPQNHMNGSECVICSYEKRSEEKKSNTSEFITKAKEVHGNKYLYINTMYEAVFKKVKIECPIHGEFEQAPSCHLNGSGCPICKESKGERKVRLYLNENNIKFIPQHKFPDCKNIKPLPFDFYLPEHNICIEYHGNQHYKPISYFGGELSLKKQIKRDEIKSKYCEKNEIKLIIFNDDIDKINFVI